MLTRRFQAEVHPEGEMFIAVCPELGTASRGYTFSEAIANLAGGLRFEVASPPRALRGTTHVTVTTFESEGQPTGTEDSMDNAAE